MSSTATSTRALKPSSFKPPIPFYIPPPLTEPKTRIKFPSSLETLTLEDKSDASEDEDKTDSAEASLIDSDSTENSLSDSDEDKSDIDPEDDSGEAEYSLPNEFGVRLRHRFQCCGECPDACDCSSKGRLIKIPQRLKAHQVPAIRWMLEREAQPLAGVTGGINASEMGLGKCLHPDTPVLLWDGSTKAAKNILPGDLLIGDDSTPRKVLSICQGRDQMYKISQSQGDDYIVNKAHILSLKVLGKKFFRFDPKTNCLIGELEGLSEDCKLEEGMGYEGPLIKDLPVDAYLKADPKFRAYCRGFKARVDWPFTPTSLDPYLVGYFINLRSDRLSPGLLTNSRRLRLGLLAGLLDKNGVHKEPMTAEKCFQLVECNLTLAESILFLVRSLGFIGRKESTGSYYGLQITGKDMGIIPFRSEANKALAQELDEEEPLSLLSIEPLGEGDYCGFTLDGNRRFLLGDFTVTHNTVETLNVIMHDYTLVNPPKYPTLVVCPLAAIYTWREQIELWLGESCPYLVLRKDELGKERFNSLRLEDLMGYKIVLTNYETVRSIAKKHRLYEHLLNMDKIGRKLGVNTCSRPTPEMMAQRGEIMLFNTPWERCISDESTEFCNPKSGLFYAMMCLWAPRKWCLTGTPIRNYCSDLFAQFRFLGFNRALVPKQFTLPLYREAQLDKCILYMTKEDAGIKLPKRTIVTIPIQLEGKEKEIYAYFKKATKEAHDGWMVGCISFANVLTLFLRLRQCCLSAYTILDEAKRECKQENTYTYAQKILDRMTAGLASWISDKKGTAGVKSAKILVLMELLGKIPAGQKIVVFTHFKKFIDVMEYALQLEHPEMGYEIVDGDVVGTERSEALNRFKTQVEKRVLFISYKVGAQSLNLTEAEHIVIMETTWVPSIIQQAMARSHRVGQTKKVTVYRLVIQDSIEQKMQAICDSKKELFDEFIVNKKSSGVKLNGVLIGRVLK